MDCYRGFIKNQNEDRLFYLGHEGSNCVPSTRLFMAPCSSVARVPKPAIWAHGPPMLAGDAVDRGLVRVTEKCAHASSDWVVVWENQAP